MDTTATDVASAPEGSSGRTRRSFLAVASATALVGLAGCSTRSSPSPPSDGESDQLAVDRDGYDGDAFAGTLTEGVGSAEPVAVDPGIYEGVVLYDRSCSPVGDGLTGCDAGIETQELEDVNFYYEHDMQEKPCLAPEQQVVLEVHGEEAVVQRRQ